MKTKIVYSNFWILYNNKHSIGKKSHPIRLAKRRVDRNPIFVHWEAYRNHLYFGKPFAAGNMTERQPRGRYQPAIIGFLLEYQGEIPLSPWTYSSIIPDSVLSYTKKMHYDLVILRFGRPEKNFQCLMNILQMIPHIKVQNITVFKNKKNTNRMHYLRTVIFPKMDMRQWNLKDAAKKFNGLDAFLKCLMDNDVTMDKKKWSSTQRAKVIRTLSKYQLQFIT